MPNRFGGGARLRLDRLLVPIAVQPFVKRALTIAMQYVPAEGVVARSPVSIDAVPSSLAIAGIYGHIGSLIYNAALQLGVPKIYGFDPGSKPLDFCYSDRLHIAAREEQFYEVDADLFHIATHPEVREGVYRLLERGRHINIEKPMAHPAHPDECCRLRVAARKSSGTVLFDFVEAFNPRTFQMCRILTRLRSYADFRINRIYCERGKDREDGLNPRNRKVIVPIQYQETAHCLALLLIVINRSSSFDEVFPNGITVAASSVSYNPPNPEDYRFGLVDGKVSGEILVDGMTIGIHTDFKRQGARPFKRFRVEGLANHREFVIEAIYDGTGECIVFNGKAESPCVAASRHLDIVRQSWRWHCEPSTNLRPTADFAWLVFGLSAALWMSCHEGREIKVTSEEDLRRAMQSYPGSLARYARHPALGRNVKVENRRIV